MLLDVLLAELGFTCGSQTSSHVNRPLRLGSGFYISWNWASQSRAGLCSRIHGRCSCGNRLLPGLALVLEVVGVIPVHYASLLEGRTPLMLSAFSARAQALILEPDLFSPGYKERRCCCLRVYDLSESMISTGSFGSRGFNLINGNVS